MIIRILSLFSCLIIAQHADSQRNLSDSAIGTPLLGIQYGLSWTAGDLQDRYGLFNNAGFATGYKFKSNWYVGVEGDFMFGKDIRMSPSDIFGHLADSKGNITDQNGDIASILLFSRGFHANIEVGRVFSKLGHNNNSGLMIKVGGGYLNHRMRIESNEQVIPSLEKDYKKGYDRLTTGFNASQFIGYLFMADHGFLNFYGGFFIQEGFTTNKRNAFYDQPGVPVPTETRLDILYGAKLGWLIPVYKRRPKDFYYN